MDILKAFKLDDTEVFVNILGTEDDPLFQANQIGTILGISHIRSTIANFDDDEKTVHTIHTLGGNQETTFLTEFGLYKLLGMSRKPIARHFQKWVGRVVKELRLTGKYELQHQLELEKTLAKRNIELERHNTLIQSFKSKRILYLTKLNQYNEEKYIIKLGYSNNIEARQRALIKHFGSSTFLNVFECQQNYEFELMLKRHPEFVAKRYKKVIFAEQKSSETYLLNSAEYNDLLTIIKRNVGNYQGFNPKQYIENKKLDIQQQIIELLKLQPESKELHKTLLNTVTNHNNYKLTTTTNDESEVFDDTFSSTEDDNISEVNDFDMDNEVIDNCDVPKIGESSNIPRLNTRNRKVQQYNVVNNTTFQLMTTYDGVMDVIRKNPTYSKFGIKNAAIKHTIYNGYRWFFLEVGSPDIQYNIPETVQHHSSIPKHIALLNKDKTSIDNVFASLQDAANFIEIKRKTTIYEAIKKQCLVKNKYNFQYFEQCDKDVKSKFVSQHSLPTLILPKGTKVQQLCLSSKKVLKTYDSIADVLKNNVISRAALKRACENGEAHNGYCWKYGSL
jgi:prophage antirepressor-like protein